MSKRKSPAAVPMPAAKAQSSPFFLHPSPRSFGEGFFGSEVAIARRKGRTPGSSGYWAYLMWDLARQCNEHFDRTEKLKQDCWMAQRPIKSAKDSYGMKGAVNDTRPKGDSNEGREDPGEPPAIREAWLYDSDGFDSSGP